VRGRVCVYTNKIILFLQFWSGLVGGRNDLGPAVFFTIHMASG